MDRRPVMMAAMMDELQKIAGIGFSVPIKEWEKEDRGYVPGVSVGIPHGVGLQIRGKKPIKGKKYDVYPHAGIGLLGPFVGGSIRRRVEEPEEKTAGVELNIEGYHRDPDKYERPHIEWRERRSEVAGPYPSWSLGRKKYDKEWKAREKRVQEWEKKNPDPLGETWTPETDPWKYKSESTVKTPYDNQQYGKLYSRILDLSPTAQDMSTDHAYADKPVTRDLTNKDLNRLVKSFEKHRTNEFPEEEKAFISKIKHLQRDPKAKIYRLEYS